MRKISTLGLIQRFTPAPRGAHSITKCLSKAAFPIASATTLLTLAALSGLSSATVTPYCWIRSGEGAITADGSGNGINFNSAFSCLGGGNPAAVVVPISVGGPLGPGGAVGTACTRWGFYGCTTAGMWIQDPNGGVPPPNLWSLPATNWVMEAWVLPVGTGGGGGASGSQLVSTGSNQFVANIQGGAALKLSYNFDDTYTLTAVDIGQSEAQIGDSIVTDNATWIHLAVVNVDGNDTFYVNGVAHGDPLNGASAPNGVPYIGSGQDTQRAYDGFLDEVRYSTFAAGAFQASDLLTRPAGPYILKQPVATSVWSGGPAFFDITAVIDSANTYQWQVGGTPIGNATAPELFLSAATPADSDKVYSAVVSGHGVNKTSDDAKLTVVPVETANVAYYHEAVQAESSLLAYFPVDGDTGTELSNLKNAGLKATLQPGASYDGRTTASYGERGLRLSGVSDANIPANAAFEFNTTSGGTVEAIVYLETGALPSLQTIFSVGAGFGAPYYQILASADGNFLYYRFDPNTPALQWTVAPSLAGRRAHVAMVFGTDGTVTAYVDGLSLGSQPNPGFGFSTGSTANIGSSGNGEAGFRGTIDEVAIYSAPLSATTIGTHNSRFIFGTATAPPTIQSQPVGPKSLFAGGTAVFSVKATGISPISYQWKLNGQPIQNNPSATTANLTLANTTAANSGSYSVVVTNPIGDTPGQPFDVTFGAPSDGYSTKVMGDNPSAYWRLNETSGTVLKDYAAGIDGAYSSTVDHGVAPAAGLTDLAAHFTGAGDPVPNAIVPYSPALNPTTPYTIEFWVKPDVDGGTARCVIGNQDRTNNLRSGFAVYQGLNGAFWEAHLGYGASVLFIQGKTAPAAGRWDHVAVTWNGVDTSRIFVNGTDDTADDVATGGPTVNNLSVPLEIGSRFGGGIPYQGSIDEVAFYNHQLTPEQILAHATLLPPTVATMNTPTYANGKVTLTWTGPANLLLQESNDLNTWSIVQGATSGYSTDVVGKKYYRLAQP